MSDATMPFLPAPPPPPPVAAVRPAALRCERGVNPIGIDTRSPRLSWTLQAVPAGARGGRQSAWQVLVASSPRLLQRGTGDLWDSGRAASRETLGIVYAGKPLVSGQRAWWKVRVWDGAGRPSAWSVSAWWETALLDPADWRATWIRADTPPPARDEAFYAERPAPLFRREFTVAKRVRQARVYVSGLGYYELHLNGRPVGDRLLDPAWTSYGKRVYYAVHDVTPLLRPGPNAVGALVGNGWWDPLPLRMWGRFNLREALAVGPPRLVCQVVVEYTDGSRQVIGTDGTWRAGESAVRRNSVYLGEEYDARREQPGWDMPGFDDGAWQPAVPATEPVGPLQAQPLPPIRPTRTLRPVTMTEPRPGVYIVDFGRNFAGRVRLRVRGEAGRTIVLRYGELLYQDGTLNPMTSVAGQVKRPGVGGPGAPGVAWQSDRYTCRGGGEETWSPRFTFHGFRYVEVTGWPGRPPLDALEGELLQTDVEAAGTFACSDPLLNRIWQAADWTFRSNLFSVQSDCPHREKFGYGGDIVATSEAFLLSYDMGRFYAKAVHDFADAARPNGGFTETAPFVGIADAGLGEKSGPVEWGTAHPLLLWNLRQYHGDRRLLEEQYPAVLKWMRLLESRAKDGILENGIGDHEALDRASTALTGTAFYYLNADLAAKIAGTLGRHEDAARFRALADSIRDAFNRRFLDPATGRYEQGTQAGQALALQLGLAPPEYQPKVAEALAQAVEAREGHVSTGIFGTRALLPALCETGRADLAYRVAQQRTFPGWGHMLESGATTLWETWAFSDNTFSHNHPMFGSVVEWLMKHVAGIAPAPDAAGFDRVVIRPRPGGGLTWARGRYLSARGTVSVHWRVAKGRFLLTCAVPPNVTARVYVPAVSADAVQEGGRPAAKAEGVRFRRMEDGAAVFEVGGGTYRFEAPIAGWGYDTIH